MKVRNDTFVLWLISSSLICQIYATSKNYSKFSLYSKRNHVLEYICFRFAHSSNQNSSIHNWRCKRNQYFFDLILYVRDKKRSSFSYVLIKAESDHPVRCHYLKLVATSSILCHFLGWTLSWFVQSNSEFFMNDLDSDSETRLPLGILSFFVLIQLRF